MKHLLYISVVTFSLVLRFGIAFSQYELYILDYKTGYPVPFAHVCIESLDKEMIMNRITDNDGKVIFETDKKVQIAVSALGYKTLLDTLIGKSEIILYLQPSQFNLDEVVVTAQFRPKRADQSIYNVQVLNHKKILEKGATNLSELLSNELNIRISNDAALGSGMSIQGLSGENVKILIDGVPVIGRMNGNIDLSQLNMYNVDHIEIVEGPMSVIYGSNALAGAVNIITRENLRNRYSIWQNSYYESVGVYNFDLGATLNVKRNAFLISSSRNFFGGYSDIDSLRSKQWKPKLQYNVDIYYIFKKNRLKLKLDTRFFDETIQNKGPLLPPYFEKAFDSYFYTRRWTYKALIDYDFSEGNKFELISSLSDYSRIKNNYLNDLTLLEQKLIPGSAEHDTTRFNAILIRGTFTNDKQDSKIKYQAGFDMNTENGEGKRILDSQQTFGDYAGFLSIQYLPGDRLSFQPGFRFGYNTKYKAPFVPSLNLKWTLTSKTTVRASYARGFRAPSLKELYLYFVDINHNLRGNPDLQAEYSHNMNITTDLITDKNYSYYGLHSSIFYNSILNRITLAIDSVTVYSYVNIDKFKTFGGQVNFQYKLHPRFSFEIGIYEVGRKSSFFGDQENENRFRYSTDISSNVAYKWLSTGITMSMFYKYTGKLPQFYTDEDGEITEGFIESFHTLDLSLTKSFLNDLIILSLGGKNLFDNKNIEASGITTGAHASSANSYPVGWGRTFYASLRFQISKF